MNEALCLQTIGSVITALTGFVPCYARCDVVDHYISPSHLRDYFINCRIPITKHLAPVFSFVCFKFGDADRCVFCTFELTDNNIFYIIGFQESSREVHVEAVIEIADLVHTILHPGGHQSALLALVPVPADNT